MDVLQATGHDADWGGKYATAELCLDRNDPQYARNQMQFQQKGLCRCFRRDQHLVGGGLKTGSNGAFITKWAVPEPEG